MLTITNFFGGGDNERFSFQSFDVYILDIVRLHHHFDYCGDIVGEPKSCKIVDLGIGVNLFAYHWHYFLCICGAGFS